MNIAVNEQLQLSLATCAATVTLTPGQAFDLAEDLIRLGVRRAIEEEANAHVDVNEDTEY